MLQQQGPSKWLRIAVFAIAVCIVLYCFLQVEDIDRQETNITSMIFLMIMFAVSMSIMLVIIVNNFLYQ